MDETPTRAYLDYNATAEPLAEAVEAAALAMTRCDANPSSTHADGRAARRLIEDARGAVADLVDASPAEVVFTSGGTEANAAGVWGLALAGGMPVRPVVMSAVEHPSVEALVGRLAGLGCETAEVGVDGSGVVRMAELDAALSDRPDAVLCLQLANQETGVLQPVREAVAVARKHRATFHCDAVQGAGRVPLSFRELGVDTMTLAAHKLGGIPGAGALIVRVGLELEPLIPGPQEGNRRGGTEAVPAIVAFGTAARLARQRLAVWNHVAKLRERLEHHVSTRLPGVIVLGAEVPRLPNTVCLGLPPPLHGGAVVAALDLEGIAVSSGPACSSGVERRSSVALAMGMDTDAAGRTVRVSLGPQTTEAQLERLVVALEAIASRTRGGAQ